jgi:hypothetical protein
MAKEEALLSRLRPGFDSLDKVVAAFGLQGVKEAPDDIAVLLVAKGSGTTTGTAVTGAAVTGANHATGAGNETR